MTARSEAPVAPAAARRGGTPGETDRNPEGLGLFALLREDLRTHGGSPFEQGFWALAVHRYGNRRMRVRPRILRLPFSLLYWTLFRFVEWTCGISLLYTVRVGRRVRIWHHGGIILNAESIGDDVQIRQNTTLGLRRRGGEGQLPVIEARVDVGCGACILGPVRVGHDSAIGANAVVLCDVPPHALAVGVPARVIRR